MVVCDGQENKLVGRSIDKRMRRLNPRPAPQIYPLASLCIFQTTYCTQGFKPSKAHSFNPSTTQPTKGPHPGPILSIALLKIRDRLQQCPRSNRQSTKTQPDDPIPRVEKHVRVSSTGCSPQPALLFPRDSSLSVCLASSPLLYAPK